jgi:hypothetical protein
LVVCTAAATSNSGPGVSKVILFLNISFNLICRFFRIVPVFVNCCSYN